MTTNNNDDYEIRITCKDEISIINCNATKGIIIIELYKIWSPNGYEH